jgi:GT2 family glycosyltransferase/tetratricopeptide (TPR) repeat protein
MRGVYMKIEMSRIQFMKRISIIIPSLGVPEILVPTIYSIINSIEGNEEVRIYVSIDNHLATDLDECIRQISPLMDNYSIQFIENDRQAGFASNCNSGLTLAKKHDGDDVGIYIFCNDDVRVPSGWISGMYDALYTEFIFLQSNIGVTDEPYPIEKYGKIGIVGPCSDNVAGLQCVKPPEIDSISISNTFNMNGGKVLNNFAQDHKKDFFGKVLSSDYISGMCLGILPECLDELCEIENDRHILFDERFKVGGFEDNDLCMRAVYSGWKLGIAQSAFIHHIGHQTLDAFYPEMKRGLNNYQTFIDKWKEILPKENKVVACYRVSFGSLFEFNIAKQSLKRTCCSVDGISFLLTQNPRELFDSPGWANFYNTLDKPDIDLLTTCSSGMKEEIETALNVWLSKIIEPYTVGRSFDVCCKIWEGKWNERDERNKSIEMAESLDADWILSVDADEILEKRATYSLIHKLVGHPNPQCMKYDFAWVNHWDSDRLCRYDEPWGDGGAYTHHMRGFRLWRVIKKSPRRIIAGTDIGLHCGNCPEYGSTTNRMTNIRFRHFGTIDTSERYRKFKMYNELDRTMNRVLVGNSSYDHIIAEEDIRTYTYSPFNGIGLSMLAYEKEDPLQIWEKIDYLFGMCDKMVFTWTSSNPLPNWAKKFSENYGVIWSQKLFEDSLSSCRNDSIDKIEDGAVGSYIGWVLVLDPDEIWKDWFSFCSTLRREVEASDTFGWLYEYNNIRKGNQSSYSESVRLFRLHTKPQIRFSGNVHETVEESLGQLRSSGVKAMCRVSKNKMLNLGLAISEQDLQKKVSLYANKLVKGLEDNQNKDGYWICLGLQYGNDGDFEKQEECLKRAVSLNPRGYLSYKEYALFHLRQSMTLLKEAGKRLPSGHPHYMVTMKILSFLDEYVAEQPKLDTIPLDLPLPNFEYPNDKNNS